MGNGTKTAVLLVDCPDRKGLVAALSTFLYSHGADIMHADEHRDATLGWFFMRIEWGAADFDLSEDDLRRDFSNFAEPFEMRWRLKYPGTRPRVAILVSHYLHCLNDLLHRHESGELNCEIPLIVSNHQAAAPLAAFYRLPFHYLPVNQENKKTAEETQLKLMADHHVDLIVLARYMQILSSDFVSQYPGGIINVHHSFLPAISGAKPYHAALERGVKIIGATSHYVTAVLDAGPIIEQDIVRVTHRDELEDVVRKGRDLERVVLSRAVRWHLEHRILQYANKTVVFD